MRIIQPASVFTLGPWQAELGESSLPPSPVLLPNYLYDLHRVFPNPLCTLPSPVGETNSEQRFSAQSAAKEWEAQKSQATKTAQKSLCGGHSAQWDDLTCGRLQILSESTKENKSVSVNACMCRGVDTCSPHVGVWPSVGHGTRDRQTEDNLRVPDLAFPPRLRQSPCIKQVSWLVPSRDPASPLPISLSPEACWDWRCLSSRIWFLCGFQGSEPRLSGLLGKYFTQ